MKVSNGNGMPGWGYGAEVYIAHDKANPKRQECGGGNASGRRGEWDRYCMKTERLTHPIQDR